MQLARLDRFVGVRIVPRWRIEELVLEHVNLSYETLNDKLPHHCDATNNGDPLLLVSLDQRKCLCMTNVSEAWLNDQCHLEPTDGDVLKSSTTNLMNE